MNHIKLCSVILTHLVAFFICLLSFLGLIKRFNSKRSIASIDHTGSARQYGGSLCSLTSLEVTSRNLSMTHRRLIQPRACFAPFDGCQLSNFTERTLLSVITMSRCCIGDVSKLAAAAAADVVFDHSSAQGNITVPLIYLSAPSLCVRI